MDTNVLVYAVDDADAEKRDIARGALESGHYGELVLSAQVLSEFYVTVIRKLAEPVSKEKAAEMVDWLGLLNPTISIDTTLIKRAIQTSRSARLSYWDSLIVAAAAQAGCELLLTEDLNDGQEIDSVRVENPFRDLA